MSERGKSGAATRAMKDKLSARAMDTGNRFVVRECPRCHRPVTLAPHIKAVWANHWPPSTYLPRRYKYIPFCEQSGLPLKVA